MIKKIIKRVLIFLLIAALAFALYYLYSYSQNKQEITAVKMNEIRAEAAPYEKELEQLKTELHDLEVAYAERKEEDEKSLKNPSVSVVDAVINQMTSPERGRVITAFRLSTYYDVNRIDYFAERIAMRPVVIVDCTLDDGTLNSIHSVLLNREYEVIITGSPFNDTTLENLKKTKELLADTKLTDTGVFLLDGSDDYEDNLAMLAEAGIQRCFRLAGFYSTSVRDDGLVCVSYGNINSKNFSLKDSLRTMADNKNTMMYVFDLGMWENTYENDAAIVSFLDTIGTYTSDGTLINSTVVDAFEDAKVYTTIQQDQDKERVDFYLSTEAAIAEKKARIAELEQTIFNIYSKSEALA